MAGSQSVRRVVRVVIWILLAQALSGCFSRRRRFEESAIVPEKSRGLLFGGAPQLAWPTNGTVNSPFGKRGRGFHHGIDIKAPVGSDLVAADTGHVIYSGWQQGFGYVVKIEHTHGMTLYAHCRSLFVAKGERVERGTVIATLGRSGNATGPHVHFEYHRGGRAVNPKDFLHDSDALLVMAP